MERAFGLELKVNAPSLSIGVVNGSGFKINPATLTRMGGVKDS